MYLKVHVRRIYLILLSSAMSLFGWLPGYMNCYPIPFYYLSRGWSRQQIMSPIKIKSDKQDSTRDDPISYRLNVWSQYDNPEEGVGREGDILNHPLYRKTMTSIKNLLWTGGIVPYYVHDSIVNNSGKLAVLEDAIDNIMEKTCIRFMRIYPDESGHLPLHNWVNITGDQEGCFSDLGRNELGYSLLNLDVTKCFRTIGHSLHEILHILGVYHEHMRPDRDEYINILWNNIKDGDSFNFGILNKTAVTTYGLPYDYDSVMHYSMTAFSKDKAVPTIIPKNPVADIGQRNHLSFYDIQKLLITYNCNNENFQTLHRNKFVHHPDQLEILNLDMNVSANHVEPIISNTDTSNYDKIIDVPYVDPLETHRRSMPRNSHSYNNPMWQPQHPECHNDYLFDYNIYVSYPDYYSHRDRLYG